LDRNTKNKKMMKTKYFMFGFLLFLFGCKEPKFENSDFVGTWKSDDGAIIVFNQDGSCILKDLNYSIISIANNPNEKLNSIGNWKVISGVENGITGGISTGVEVSYKLMDREGQGGINFYISGQGFSENALPWDLFIWKGDPDEMEKYKFVKQK
jgi:hypothetical protein